MSEGDKEDAVSTSYLDQPSGLATLKVANPEG